MKLKSIRPITNQMLACGEGPVWDASQNKLYCTDCMGQDIYVYHAPTASFEVFNTGFRANSLALLADHSLAIAAPDGFYQLKNGLVTLIAKETNGKPIHKLNDLLADPAGRLYSGQECFVEGEKYDTGFLYCVQPDGKAGIVDDGFHLANGMAISPDQSTFYIADTITRQIWQYDYSLATGNLTHKHLLITLGQSEGMPDGLALDSKGNLWVACFLGAQLICIAPDGKILGRISLPFAQPTSLVFADERKLYLTSASFLWETSLASENIPDKMPKGGHVYELILEL